MDTEGDTAAIVTGLLRRDGQGLLVHRAPSRRWFPDCWDLPGGHVEEGENPDDALRRELAEELGVTADVFGPPHRYFRGETFRMATWIIDGWTGEPANRAPIEHDAVGWYSYDQTTPLTLAHTGLSGFLRDALSAPNRSCAC